MEDAGCRPAGEHLRGRIAQLVDPLLDAMEVPQEAPPAPRTRLFQRAELCNLHPDCLAEVTSEPPYYQELYERVRIEEDLNDFKLDRPRWQLQLLREAEKEYAIKPAKHAALAAHHAR